MAKAEEIMSAVTETVMKRRTIEVSLHDYVDNKTFRQMNGAKDIAATTTKSKFDAACHRVVLALRSDNRSRLETSCSEQKNLE